MFDFDRVVDRRGTHSSKWDNMARLSGITSPDAIPMWVADMDFIAPPGVTAALAEEVERATHGYYADTGSWAAACVDWLARRHGLSGQTLAFLRESPVFERCLHGEPTAPARAPFRMHASRAPGTARSRCCNFGHPKPALR